MERDRYYSEREAKGETKVSLSGIADNSVIYILTKVFPSFFFFWGGWGTAGYCRAGCMWTVAVIVCF